MNAPIRDRRRRALIEATIAVIARHGASGATVSRVARKAGVSIGLMNFHFKSKDRLLRETFRYLSEEYEKVWRDNLIRVRTAPLDRLKAMIETNFDRRIFTAEKLAVWFAFWSDAELRDRYRAAATRVERRYIEEIEAEIAHLLRGNRQRGPSAGDVARPLMAMIDGFWLQSVLSPRGFSRIKAIATCLTFIEQRLSAASPRLPRRSGPTSLSTSA
jgi:TetR/AcrR family transcriptional regulator, transcriptional repressor of bet genes